MVVSKGEAGTGACDAVRKAGGGLWWKEGGCRRDGRRQRDQKVEQLDEVKSGITAPPASVRNEKKARFLGRKVRAGLRAGKDDVSINSVANDGRCGLKTCIRIGWEGGK